MNTKKERNMPGGRRNPTHPDDIDPNKTPVKEEPSRSGKFSHEKNRGTGKSYTHKKR